LTENIYDAGVNPDYWSDVVVRLNDFIGSRACGLISKDSVSKSGVTHYYCGVDPHYIQLYAETYSRYDPLAVLPRYGEVRSIPDLVDFEQYRRGRFYQEWLKPQGCADVANVLLEKSSSICPVLMSVIPGKQMLDAEQRARMQVVVPHLSRALMINRALETRQRQATAFADVLEAINTGVILLDGGCRIVHCNRAAQAILATDSVLRSVAGRLEARSPAATAALREVFRGEGEVAAAAAACRTISLTSHDGHPYVVQILPIASIQRDGTAEPSSGAVGALFVWKAELDSRSCVEPLARAFDLTPTETRVLQSIIDIGGVPETAAQLGIAETTVKTHLQRIFAKTGVSRQADLIRRAAGFAGRLLS
jgi:DNA-binding CsgD family transcriptional regulator